MRVLSILILAALLAGCESNTAAYIRGKDDALNVSVGIAKQIVAEMDSVFQAETARLQWNEKVYKLRCESADALIQQLEDSLKACRERP